MTSSRWALTRCLGLTVLCTALVLGGCVFEGPPGPQGEQGIQGQQGLAGQQGLPGEQGLSGEQGPAGAVGDPGQDGRGAPGAPGAPGTTGPQGQQGPGGPQGPTGPQGPIGPPFQPPVGTPIVESLSDVTGGLLVVGDLLGLAGSSLDGVDVVLVGEQVAPVLGQIESALLIQIPAGVANGANTIRLINFTSDLGFTEALAAVNVHRLAIFMGSLNDKIVIVDTTDHSVVARIDRTIATLPGELLNPPYDLAFANHGSLALVPTGDGEVTWIDLTSVGSDESVVPVNGVVDLHPGEANDPPNMTTIGVAVSPDNELAVVGDEKREQLWALTIDESFPPYAAPIGLGAGTPLETGLETGPRCPAFVSDGVLVVPYILSNELAVIERDGDTLGPLITTVPAADRPAQISFLPERAALLLAGRGDPSDPNSVAELEAFLVGGTTVGNPLNVNLQVDELVGFGLSPAGNFAYTISLNSDLVTAVLVADTVLAYVADSSDTLSRNQPRSVAVEPVGGEFLYVGFSVSAAGVDMIDILDITNGTTLTQHEDLPLEDDPDLARCFGIGFQP